ncbi:SpoIIE family protein phosphatase [Halalkalibacter krulwichiae]|uniref:Phosphoserine phosphatase RsbP n=1 Tax=Halalkalibacter krulwichiae TaxID=199441 RepID=A0A1X9M9N6_9BACI|nr:SpoIIE family protein phosphatase [Halalkalibacter krulwichiae]ARK30169.1 Phosphoserine phosphatase RsbP [Halalkalibacter krulwichiae]
MDEKLNFAPCGFLTLSEDGDILAINQTLLNCLSYTQDNLQEEHINSILTVPSQLFYQLYFVPLLKLEKKIEEMYISLRSRNGEEIPVVINARPTKQNGKIETDCIVFPMRIRNQYENELLAAKKEAESALNAKNKAHAELEVALKDLETKQQELLELNKQNQTYKINTKKELELARKIQETSVTEPIVNDNIQIDSFYEASNELSGDIYGFYQLDDNRYGVILLDVMGHGISSALITMSLHSLFHRLFSKGVNTEIVMKELDNHLHSLFQNNSEAWHYCTAINLVIDTREKKIEYINAGHPPALWQDSSGEIHELSSKTPPLGTFEGISFNTTSFSYSEGGRLLLYTDGVTDPLGSNQLHTLLKENQSISISKLKERIINSLTIQENMYHKSDDQCFILIDLNNKKTTLK